MVHFIVSEVQPHKVFFSLQHPIAPIGVVLDRFDALQQAQQANHHWKLGFSPCHPFEDGVEHAVGVHGGMCVEQEGWRVAKLQHTHVALGMHVGTDFVGQLLHLFFGVDDIPRVQEFVQDRGEILHGGLDQKFLFKFCLALHSHAFFNCPLLQRDFAEGKFQVAVEFDLGELEKRVVSHGGKFQRMR